MKHDEQIKDILHSLVQGELSLAEAERSLRLAPYQQLFEGLNIDHQRFRRTGHGETVLAQGKSFERLLAAITGLAQNVAPSVAPNIAPDANQNTNKTPVLATRVSAEQGERLLAALSGNGSIAEFWPEAGLFSYNKALNLAPPWPNSFTQGGHLVIVTAGAADMPVALEALGTARFYGLAPVLAPDIGVAGLHRLQPWLDTLHQAELVIAVAGMDGALPSVLAGLCRCPVLGVPTSVGYGVATGGYSAMLNMLSSCASGLAVLNIDNGYGAAMFAAKLLQK